MSYGRPEQPDQPILERVFLYSWKGKDYYMTPMRPMTPKDIRRVELHLKEFEDASHGKINAELDAEFREVIGPVVKDS
jgi:hypothetical protein